LSLYCAAAALHPTATLPISLDVGTDNPALLNDPGYLGHRAKRLRGDAYIEFMDEFVQAVVDLCPDVILQWEDLRSETAVAVLDRYHERLPSFNDDIQGTGAVAVAGIRNASKRLGLSMSEHRVVIFGGGAAGLGIKRQIELALRRDGLSPVEARERIAVLDSRGLIGGPEGAQASYKGELSLSATALERFGLQPRSPLSEVVKAFAPTVLIGTSGVAGAFSESIIRDMADRVTNPVIMPFSNPDNLSEAIPQNVIEWTHGRALVATGSPFPDVQYGGKRFRIGQGNNVFVFPGLGLGALAAKARRVTPSMLAAASDAVAESTSAEEIADGMLFPGISRLPHVTANVAAAVAKACLEETGERHGFDWEAELHKLRWVPNYPELKTVAR
jgi:malate dehydrogenase (oxaloacetate-decarboxylating)